MHTTKPLIGLLAALSMAGCSASDPKILQRPTTPYTGKAKFMALRDKVEPAIYEQLKADGWELAVAIDDPEFHDYYVLVKEPRQ